MGFRLQGPARRIAIAIGVLVLLVVTASIFTIARYNDSRQADSKALDESQTQFLAQQIRTEVTAEGGLADAYGGDADPADLVELGQAKRDLAQALHALKESPGLDPDEVPTVDAIAAGQRRLESIFDNQLAPVAGTSDFDEGVFPYDEQVERMEKQIDAFDRATGQEAVDAASSSDSTASSARTAAVIAALLAAVLAIAIGVYVVRLVSRLLNRISGTAAILAPMAREMEAAIGETATATSEQSSAVAEAAATAEELTATATSIADNAKAGSAAAEQTGETMRDMQEQVQAIGDRLHLLLHVAHRLARLLGRGGAGLGVVGDRGRRRGQLFGGRRSLGDRRGLLAGGGGGLGHGGEHLVRRLAQRLRRGLDPIEMRRCSSMWATFSSMLAKRRSITRRA